MLKNILNLEGSKKLNKEEQKSVKGGMRPVPIQQCTYTCSGTRATLNNGNYLNCPAIINDAVQCGGSGNGTQVWA